MSDGAFTLTDLGKLIRLADERYCAADDRAAAVNREGSPREKVAAEAELDRATDEMSAWVGLALTLLPATLTDAAVQLVCLFDHVGIIAEGDLEWQLKHDLENDLKNVERVLAGLVVSVCAAAGVKITDIAGSDTPGLLARHVPLPAEVAP